MAAQSDESPVLRGVLIFLAALVLYVLSIGPASRIVWNDRAFLNTAIGDTAYFPLLWVAAHCEPAAEALEWYVHFCLYFRF